MKAEKNRNNVLQVKMLGNFLLLYITTIILCPGKNS